MITDLANVSSIFISSLKSATTFVLPSILRMVNLTSDPFSEPLIIFTASVTE